MIVRHGQLVHSWGDIDKRQGVKSVTKSMGGIVLGLAFDENKVTLTGKGVDYMPTFGTPPDTNAPSAQLDHARATGDAHGRVRQPDGGFVGPLHIETRVRSGATLTQD